MSVKVMVVDDEPDLELLIRQKFKKQVRNQELELVFAINGRDALEKLAQVPADLMLTDINMPEMDGLTLLGEIASRYPLMKAVVVSAYGDMSNIRTAMNRGAFDFVTKPIDFADLEITITKTIQEVQTLQQAIRNRDQLVSLQKELDIANKIQQSILPQTFPTGKEFEICAKMAPAREIGGDLYDFFTIDANRVGFVIGDVSGKGIPAALFMAMSRAILKTVALKGMTPGECFREINRVLHKESLPTMFLTAFYGILDTRLGKVTFCCAGHNAPYLIRSGGQVQPINVGNGIPLSFLPDYPYEDCEIKLENKDSIFLYTDGVTEAFDRNGNEFAEARLESCLAGADGSAPSQLIQNVFDAVKEFANGAVQSDDITALAIRFQEERR